MKKQLLASVAVACMAFGPSIVKAEDAGSETAGIKPYISMFAGGAALKDLTNQYFTSSGSSGLYSKVPFQRGYLIGGAVGLQLNDMVRVEAEVSRARWQAKGVDYLSTNGGVPTSTVNVVGPVTATYLLANAWLDLKNESRFTPYVGGGIGAGWANAHVDAGGYGAGDGIKAGLAFQVGAGLKMAVSDHVSLDLGYRYKSLRDIDFANFGTAGGSYDGNNLNSHNVQLGLTYSGIGSGGDELRPYVSVFAGAGLPRDITGFAVGGSNTGVTLEGGLDKSYLIGGAFGANISDNVRLEAELSRSRMNASKTWHSYNSSGSTFTTNVTGGLSATYLLANAWYDLPIEGKFRPYLGAGAGLGFIGSDIMVTPTVGIGDSVTPAIALQFGAGARFDVSDRVALDVGYRYKMIEDVSLPIINATNAANIEDVDFRSHNVQVGLTYKF
jgi:opacity protein-like surface antigen